jgi:hypothetical protein
MANNTGFRWTPLMVSSISATFSAGALIATTIGTWVSWNARDDYLEAVALNEAVSRCASAVAVATDYHRTLEAMAADLGADFAAMQAPDAEAAGARLAANLQKSGELADELSNQLVWLQFVHVMRFPEEAGEANPFLRLDRAAFDLFTEFNGTIQITADRAAIPAALEPVLARIAETGPALYGLCSDLASRR